MAQNPGDPDLGRRLRGLPAVDRVVARLEGEAAGPVLVGAARRAIDRARGRVREGGDPPTLDQVVDEARALLGEHALHQLQGVINATGVLVHTNLGRVPLGEEQLEAVAEIASGYSNVEYDLVAGRRGDRYSHVGALLVALTGAESALVVNNNAAAVLLVLATLCEGREVIVSRGELIEIGGEFRIPEVMAASGARLVEVGTTNRTHLSDYEKAITPQTAAVMKVHPSNYRVVGFTATVEAHSIATLAKKQGVLFLHDLGSGFVGPPEALETTDRDPLVQVALEDGADLVTFSGDKLLGGPQAGVIVGRGELVEKLARHPLLRALRVDKMTLAALQTTVLAHVEGRSAELPVWRLALAQPHEIEARARSLASALSERVGDRVKVEAVPSSAVTGGGSLPGTDLASWAVSIVHEKRSTASLERSLRHGTIPVIARIEDDRLLLDLRSVPALLDETLHEVVVLALQE